MPNAAAEKAQAGACAGRKSKTPRQTAAPTAARNEEEDAEDDEDGFADLDRDLDIAAARPGASETGRPSPRGHLAVAVMDPSAAAPGESGSASGTTRCRPAGSASQETDTCIASAPAAAIR